MPDTEWPDLIRRTAELAAAEFGGGDGMFNAANFSVAFRKVAGVNSTLDGTVVRAMLSGRKDIRPESPGHAYYQLLPKAVPACYLSGWPVEPDDALAADLYAACMDMPLEVPFGALAEWQRDEYRMMAERARAFIEAEVESQSVSPENTPVDYLPVWRDDHPAWKGVPAEYVELRTVRVGDIFWSPIWSPSNKLWLLATAPADIGLTFGAHVWVKRHDHPTKGHSLHVSEDTDLNPSAA